MIGRFLADDTRDTFRSLVRRLRFRRARDFDTMWARRGTRDSDPELVAFYHRARSAAMPHLQGQVHAKATPPFVDDRTWTDLDGDRLFAEINVCMCPIGEQVLYRMLRSPETTIEPLLEHDTAADRLAAAAPLRRRLQQALSRLDARDPYYLPNLFGWLPPRPRLWFLFPFLTLLAVALIVLLFFQPIEALAGLVAVSAINLTIQYRYHGRVHPYVRPLTLVNRMLDTAATIGGLDDPVLGGTFRELAGRAGRIKALSRAARYVAVERRWDDIAGAAYAYANMLLLLDVNAFIFSVDSIARHRGDMEAIFERLGFLDASISIASWRASHAGGWCRPSFLPRGRRLELRDIVHPMLEDAVGNDLDVDGRSVLITGSNMAGKTTFIRAVAMNAILALSLVRSAESDEQHLFVIDEIFRGTNTVERVAAARESIADGRLVFDYRIRPGPTSTHNALRMMEVYGFPQASSGMPPARSRRSTATGGRRTRRGRRRADAEGHATKGVFSAAVGRPGSRVAQNPFRHGE